MEYDSYLKLHIWKIFIINYYSLNGNLSILNADILKQGKCLFLFLSLVT